MREIMKYAPPPPTLMFVAIAAIERPVSAVMTTESVTIRMVPISPTLPSTQGKRRNMMTPRIVRRLGRNTPLKVPNPYPMRSEGVGVAVSLELAGTVMLCEL